MIGCVVGWRADRTGDEGGATFRLLGPVAVLDPAGTPLLVGGPRRRALLAALLLHPGSSLPVERLVGMLWPDPPPPAASTMVHEAVAAIRRVLEPGAPHLLVTRDGGYVLEVPPERVDAARFERALEAGRRLLATSPQRASSLLAEALAEWRGPALAGVEEPFARAAAARLDELRLQCCELHADAELRTRSMSRRNPVRPPEAAATFPPGLLVIDAASYRNPAALPPGQVLVIGSGQTGCQISEELHEAGREVFLACGRAPWVPRNQDGRDIVSWLRETRSSTCHSTCCPRRQLAWAPTCR
jgi:hypothetical protein